MTDGIISPTVGSKKVASARKGANAQVVEFAAAEFSSRRWVTDGIISPTASSTKVASARKGANAQGSRTTFSSRRWVTDGTRTRNSQNHNLELYH